MRTFASVMIVVGYMLAGTASAETLALVERAATDKTIDLGQKGDSVGDLLVFANPVFDSANQRQLGTDQG